MKKKLQVGEGFNVYIVALGVFLIVLTGVVIAVDPVSWWKRRLDSMRLESLKEMSVALEEYYDDFGRYPRSSTEYYIFDNKTKKGIEWGKSWVPYLPVLPTDHEKEKSFVYLSPDYNNNQSYGLYASFYFPEEIQVACRMREDGACSGVPVGVMCGKGICTGGVSSPNSSP